MGGFETPSYQAEKRQLEAQVFLKKKKKICQVTLLYKKVLLYC